jgi:hypothetical protein
MPTFFNPAATLTANRVPFAKGGGTLADDSSLAFDAGTKLLGLKGAFFNNGTSGRGTLGGVFPGLLTDANTKSLALGGGTDNGDSAGAFVNLYGNANAQAGLLQLGAGNAAGGAIDFSTGGTTGLRLTRAGSGVSGVTLFGGASDQGNGRAQLPSHTTPSGGWGFYDFSFYRSGAGAARTGASFQADGGFVGNGALLSGLNASNLASGTVADARLSANVPLLAVANTFLDAITIQRAGTARLALSQQGVRAWYVDASGGNLNFSSSDNNAGCVFQNGVTIADGKPFTMGGDAYLGFNGQERWMYDCDGNVILKKRSATIPATLADVIAILKYHGLCS